MVPYLRLSHVALLVGIVVMAAVACSKEPRPAPQGPERPATTEVVPLALPSPQALSRVTALLPSEVTIAVATFLEDGNETLTVRLVPSSRDSTQIADHYAQALGLHRTEMQELLGSPDDEPDPSRAAFIQSEL